MTAYAFFSNLNVVPTIPPNPAVTALAVGPWRTGADRALTTGLSNRSLTVSINDPDEMTFDVEGHSPDAFSVNEGISDVKWTRNGVPLSVGRLLRSEETGDDNTTKIACTTTDYRGLLDRRNIIGDYSGTNNGTRTYSGGTPLEDVAWDLIAHVQAQPGGDMGITKGVWPVTGNKVAAPYIQFSDGDSVWKCLKTLMANPRSFELNIDAYRRANLYAAQRGGGNRGAQLVYGGNVTRFSRTVDMTLFGNAVRQSGASPSLPTTIVAPDIATRPEGRWDAAFSNPALLNPATVAAAGAYNYGLASTLLPVYDLTMTLGGWGGPDHVWVGDIVTVVIRAGRLTVNDRLRVFTIKIALDAENQETVTITVGRPKVNPFKSLSSSVAYLNKR